MQKIIAILLLSLTSTAYALPNCPSDQSVRLHNCFGAYTWVSGNKYVGEWKNNKQHGQGTYTWVSGNKYVGEYKDGKRHGLGTYTFDSGGKYVGEYKDGKRHGQGTLTRANGKTLSDFWAKGTHYGTKAQWDAKERERIAKEETPQSTEYQKEEARKAVRQMQKSFEKQGLPLPNSNGCVDNKEVARTVDALKAMFVATGVLSSNSCGQRAYAEKKMSGFFEKAFVPWTAEQVKSGDYPKNCPSFMFTILTTMELDTKGKAWSPPVCIKAKELVRVTGEQVGF